jgi:hypothetical protein
MLAVPINDYRKVRLELRRRSQSCFPLIGSVLERTQIGAVYTDTADNYFVLNRAGFAQVFLSGNDDSLVVDFISNSEMLPAYLHIYEGRNLLTSLEKTPLTVRQRERQQFRYEYAFIDVPTTPPTFEIRDCSTLEFNQLKKFGLNLENRFWKSESDFLEHGFGKCVVANGVDPASICYAASVYDEIAEIDVATMPAFRGKGLAKIVAANFVAGLLHNGLSASWDCFTENAPSVAAAKSLQFKLVKKYIFLSVFNKEKHEKGQFGKIQGT